MKSLIVAVAVSVVSASFAEDYVIEAAGTRTLPSPVSYGALDNRVSDGAVKFDQSGYSKTAEQANSFTAFKAVAGANTTFLGGYWDFGVTAADDVTENFFASADTEGTRTTTLDGAVIRNVGALYVGGTSGNNNTILLKNEAELQVNRLVLGMKNGSWQNSKISITDGSLLHCRGWVSMNDGIFANSRDLTGNELSVSGLGSRLVVDGATYLDRPTGDGSRTGVGGNALIVSDGARASLQQLYIHNSNYHGVSNRVTVSKNACLETTDIKIATEWSGANNKQDYARFEVLDGAVVTNTGNLQIGYHYSKASHGSVSVIVSNGTFYTEKAIPPTLPLLCAENCEIVISGSDAVFHAGRPSADTPLFGTFATNSQVVIENGAEVTDLPVNFGFSYGSNSCTDDRIIVRTGARLDCGNIFMSSYGGTGVGTRNEIIVCNQGVVKADQFWCNAEEGVVTVEDATLECTNGHYWKDYGGLNIGGKAATSVQHQGRGCVLNIKGHTPKIKTTNNRILVENESKVVFHLPADGYAAEAQPLMTTTTSRYFGFTVIDEGCAIEFVGAQEMLNHHRDVLKCRTSKYTLLESYEITIPDSVLEAANASLPDGMQLKVETPSAGVAQLNLYVKPKFGLVMTIR